MRQKSKSPKKTKIRIPDEEIRYTSDFQLPWNTLLAPLRQGRFALEVRSIHGDAPKDFIRVREYIGGKRSHPARPSTWPGYIAKVGSKWYPVESITEHLVTRVGQTCGVVIADSQLRIVGNQVRFFLNDRSERLSHGLDLFRVLLDDETVEKIADERREREVYTFESVRAAFELMFEQCCEQLTRDFVTLLGFDAFVGNNDRHPMNWGIIVPIRNEGKIRFSPVFDSARALFWNVSEQKIKQMLANPTSLDAYIRRSQPQIGWNNWQPQGSEKFDHFTLVALIARHFPQYRHDLERFTAADLIPRCEDAIEHEFSTLLSIDRRRLIVQCLERRQKRLAQALL
ncbi:hypothetical protein IAD21_00696 [Abditibacteriota bacterium]|nr:hypothetical protein IAD21_00696 [Abditibacteriota bacterium]